MKSISAITFTLCLIIGFSSCNSFKAENDQLVEENTALKKQINDAKEEGKLVRGEYSEAIETLNAIEDTLRAISDREKQIQKLANSKEFNGNISQRQAILKRLQALKDANDQSKNQAKQMQARLNSYRIENEQLRKMIAQKEAKVLTVEQELEDAQGVIDDLRDALGKMEGQLLESQGDLAVAYEDLKKKNEDLASTNDRLTKTISELNRKTVFIEEQAKGYVACGTKRVLRKKGILSRTSVKLTKQYQSAVKANSSSINYFESDEVACGTDGEIIKVLPARSEDSYSINGNMLKINNPEEFWKTDKIVVLVKK